jgi:hypothetical protein
MSTSAEPLSSGPRSSRPSETDQATRGEATSYEVLGRTVGLPVEVRAAAQWTVQYLVPLTAAQRLVDPTGLEATGPLPGRALVALAVCRYDDTDLDSYHEVALSVVVRPHDAPRRASMAHRLREFGQGAIGAYIHRLPVDQEFTCAAGRDVWGFPKWITTIDIDEPRSSDPQSGSSTTVRLVDDGTHILTLAMSSNGPVRLPAHAAPSYSFRDGVLRRTEWTTTSEGVSGRLGGTTMALGDHPMADELRSLGLPKRALMTSHAVRMQATFQAAHVVTPTQR